MPAKTTNRYRGRVMPSVMSVCVCVCVCFSVNTITFQHLHIGTCFAVPKDIYI